MTDHFDYMVLGLGAMGSATCYQIAKRGGKVLGIDQYSPPHRHGSSHGDSRITRQAIGEGESYVPLVLRSNEIWKEIESETGRKLLHVVGGLIMTSGENLMHHGSNFFEQMITAAKKYDIKFSLLSYKDMAQRFPQFKLTGKERGYYEYGAGYLNPEACVETQLFLAEKYGATLKKNEKVLEVKTLGNDKIEIITTKRTYETEKLILSAGPWIPKLLGASYAKLFIIYRQVLFWFAMEEVDWYFPDKCPIYIWLYGNNPNDVVYGFPAIDGLTGGVKIASEQYTSSTDPDSVSLKVTSQEERFMYEKFVEPHFRGLTHKTIKTAACLYTVTPDSNFVIDFHPEHKNIVIASPCSGHGFKHSSAIGEVLAQMCIDGKSKIDISKFSLSRFD